MARKRLDAAKERAIAVDAVCDPRSVRNYLAGSRKQASVLRQRISAALKKHEIEDPHAEAKR